MLSNAYFLAKFRFDTAENELGVAYFIAGDSSEFDELLMNTFYLVPY